MPLGVPSRFSKISIFKFYHQKTYKIYVDENLALRIWYNMIFGVYEGINLFDLFNEINGTTQFSYEWKSNPLVICMITVLLL